MHLYNPLIQGNANLEIPNVQTIHNALPVIQAKSHLQIILMICLFLHFIMTTAWESSLTYQISELREINEIHSQEISALINKINILNSSSLTQISHSQINFQEISQNYAFYDHKLSQIINLKGIPGPQGSPGLNGNDGLIGSVIYHGNMYGELNLEDSNSKWVLCDGRSL